MGSNPIGANVARTYDFICTRCRRHFEGVVMSNEPNPTICAECRTQTRYATARLRWVNREQTYRGNVHSWEQTVRVLQQEWLVGGVTEWRDVPTEQEQTADKPVVCEVAK